MKLIKYIFVLLLLANITLASTNIFTFRGTPYSKIYNVNLLFPLLIWDANALGASIPDGSGSVIGLIKSEAIIWSVTNNNTFNGNITVAAGSLLLTGINSTTGQVTISGGNLIANTIDNYGTTCSLGRGTSGIPIVIGGNGANPTLIYNGLGNTTDRQIIVGYSGNSSGGFLNNNGTGPLIFTANILDKNAGGGFTRVLTIGGTYSNLANEIQSCIVNTNGISTNDVLSITKAADNSQWILSGTNQYSGATIINGGDLYVNSIGNNATNIITVSAGGQLSGTGLVYLVNVSGKGILQAGGTNGVGVLNITNNVTFLANATNLFNIVSTSSYSSINQIGGKMNLSNAILRVYDVGYTGVIGDKFTLVATNSLANALVGTYSGLTNGATVTTVGNTYKIYYTNNVQLVHQ